MIYKREDGYITIRSLLALSFPRSHDNARDCKHGNNKDGKDNEILFATIVENKDAEDEDQDGNPNHGTNSGGTRHELAELNCSLLKVIGWSSCTRLWSLLGRWRHRRRLPRHKFLCAFTDSRVVNYRTFSISLQELQKIFGRVIAVPVVGWCCGAPGKLVQRYGIHTDP